MNMFKRKYNNAEDMLNNLFMDIFCVNQVETNMAGIQMSKKTLKRVLKIINLQHNGWNIVINNRLELYEYKLQKKDR